jgi:hypothetical protein
MVNSATCTYCTMNCMVRVFLADCQFCDSDKVKRTSGAVACSCVIGRSGKSTQVKKRE